MQGGWLHLEHEPLPEEMLLRALIAVGELIVFVVGVD